MAKKAYTVGSAAADLNNLVANIRESGLIVEICNGMDGDVPFVLVLDEKTYDVAFEDRSYIVAHSGDEA